MSLASEGAIAIWNGIRPEARADYYEWHNREHMPERVVIPGFCRGRRYRALSGEALASAGAAGVERGMYQLQYTISGSMRASA